MFKPHRYVPALIISAGVLATSACASGGYYPSQRSGYGYEIERRAYDHGYREGVKKGDEDGHKSRSFSFERHDDWRSADDGYSRSYGDREFYRRNYRRGFESGYTEAYNHYRGYGGRPRGGITYPSVGYGYPSGGYGSSGVYGSRAADSGYRDGYEAGRNDARDRNSFDPIRSSRYRSGDHDYDSRYGSKDEYKRVYRDAFQRGYDQGYRENRR